MSNLINKHIFKYLNKINNDEDSEFNENFEKLQKIASINLEDVNFDKFRKVYENYQMNIYDIVDLIFGRV